jgi:hypothetical protein
LVIRDVAQQQKSFCVLAEMADAGDHQMGKLWTIMVQKLVRFSLVRPTEPSLCCKTHHQPGAGHHRRKGDGLPKAAGDTV